MRIASFNVDHTSLNPGIYVSRIDDNVTSLDLRFFRPNSGKYFTTTQAHTIEHLMAHYLRNSSLSDCVVYYGPGGCRTMFYLLYFNNKCSLDVMLLCIVKCLYKAINHEGLLPGQSEKECGNYKDLDLDSCKDLLRYFHNLVLNWTVDQTRYEAFNE